ncbi:MAG: hypothetical protein CM15mP120_23070 [Pseudomonadota bacterium]|nr:MAG: hypothetical protein CM15mP120_23070 [Pseudomonadota bacterium]
MGSEQSSKKGALKEQVGFLGTAESQMNKHQKSKRNVAVFYDVALLLKEDNFPIASTFPLRVFYRHKKALYSPHIKGFDAEMFTTLRQTG